MTMSPAIAYGYLVILLLGLVFGSFLNVLIYRLPRMHKLSQHRQAYNLFLPGSHCPHCDAAIPMHRNVPVLSWLWLRGMTPCCAKRIGWRYPAVEILGGILSVGMLAYLHHPWMAVLATVCLGLCAACCVQFLEFGHLSPTLLHVLLWCALLLPTLDPALEAIVPQHGVLGLDGNLATGIVSGFTGLLCGVLLSRMRIIAPAESLAVPLLGAVGAWLGVVAVLLFSLVLVARHWWDTRTV